VITGDPNISIEDVGVPMSIAKNLTFPERATSWNIDEMQQLVDNATSHPGAKYLINVKSGTRIDLELAKWSPTVGVGDIIERHMIDGDYVIFNRQPSLHKMSVMAHRVRVMPFSTFRLNVNACSSYNADFDGDEMNLHMPQSYETMAELKTLSTVSKLIVSPQSNKPVNALIQDALCGIKSFTTRNIFLSAPDVMNLVMCIKSFPNVALPRPAILKPKRLWTGKQIVSLTLPSIDLEISSLENADAEDRFRATGLDMNLFRWMTPEDTRVIVRDGQIMCGSLCKKSVGSSSGGIPHVIFNDFGPQMACDFLDNASVLVNHWLMNTGFSVGLGDAMTSRNTESVIDDCVENQFAKVEQILQAHANGELHPDENLTVDQTRESRVITLLNRARDSAGKTTNDQATERNSIKHMISAGSKGSILNICQISACVGQQVINGKRIPFGFRSRTLPHFSANDHSPKSRGFVRNSFIKGVTPSEMFFHAMGGREGLIDTAVKTAETGYIQRRIVKALEDITVRYDGTVRNSRNDIIHFYYGEDGFDGASIEYQSFPTLGVSDEVFREKFYAFDEEFDVLEEDRRFLREELRLQGDRWPMPLNLDRMLTQAKKQPGQSTALSGRRVFSEIQRLRRSLIPSNLSLPTPVSPSFLFGILLSSVFASRQILSVLMSHQFDWLLDHVKTRYQAGLVQAGESVGVLAAQSIGEPATQMTLNTFHLSGMGNKTVTSGIPRLKELINAAKNIKTPGMTLFLKDSIRFDKQLANQLQFRLQFCCLKDLVETQEIYFGDCGNQDRHFTDLIDQIPDEDAPDSEDTHPWILRLVLIKRELDVRYLRMSDVVDKIMETFDEEIYVTHSDDTAKQLVIHIRMFKDVTDVSAESENCIDFLMEHMTSNFLENVTICGVPGIERTFITEKNGEFVIETDGINLRDVINFKGIDPFRIYCNDPLEMLSVFGIEIAREILISEIRQVIEGGGSYINHRHLVLLCEVMTHQGIIMSITRHGMNRANTGPLMKCTFEQSVDILLEAAMNGDTDLVRGVSENVMLGKIAPFGTGVMDVLLDENMLDESRLGGGDEVTGRTRAYGPVRTYGACGAYSHIRPSYLSHTL
jgi:DNA-directed RNA polymerase II subunit RPB1